MTCEELADLIPSVPPQLVPILLAENVSLFLSSDDSDLEIFTTSSQRTPTLSNAVASAWLSAFFTIGPTLLRGEHPNYELQRSGSLLLSLIACEHFDLPGPDLDDIFFDNESLLQLDALLFFRGIPKDLDPQRANMQILGQILSSGRIAYLLAQIAWRQNSSEEIRGQIAYTLEKYATNLQICMTAIEPSNIARLLDTTISWYRTADRLFRQTSAGHGDCKMNFANAMALRYGLNHTERDLDEALRLYEMALSLIPEGTMEHSRCKMNFAVALGKLADLYELYERQSLYAELFERVTTPGLKSAIGETLSRAATLLDQAEAEAPDNSSTKVRCRFNLAGYYRRLYKQDAGSVDFLLKAIDLYRSVASSPKLRPGERASCREQLGQALMSLHDESGQPEYLAESIRELKHAVRGFRRSRTMHGLERGLRTLGDALIRAGEYRAAVTTLREAISLFEARLEHAQYEDSRRLMLRHESGDLYSHLVYSCLQCASSASQFKRRQEYLEQAWTTVEQSKGRLIGAMLHELARRSLEDASGSSPESDRDVDSLTHLARLRRRIGVLGSPIVAPVRPGEIPRPTLLDAVRAMEDVIRNDIDGRKSDPMLSPEWRSPNLASVQETIGALSNSKHRTLLIEFFPLHEQLILFFLDGDSLSHDIVPVPSDHLIRQTWRFLETIWDSRIPDDIQDHNLESSLSWLSSIVWPSINEKISRMNSKHPNGTTLDLIFIPTGMLHFWPLWALPIPGGDTRLIDHYACSMA